MEKVAEIIIISVMIGFCVGFLTAILCISDDWEDRELEEMIKSGELSLTDLEEVNSENDLIPNGAEQKDKNFYP
jgi:hypothetical protein